MPEPVDSENNSLETSSILADLGLSALGLFGLPRWRLAK
jgi:hypothetical protein